MRLTRAGPFDIIRSLILHFGASMNLRPFYLTTLCLATFFVSSFGSSTDAQQWNHYRGPNRDGTVTSDSAVTGELKVHWKVSTNLGFSSFSLAENKALTLVSDDAVSYTHLTLPTNREV